MLAVICLFAPALIWVLVRSIFCPAERKDCRWAWEFLFCFLLLNGGIFALLRAFFKSGTRPIYYMSHSPQYACKYFALALALILIELTTERLFGKKLSQTCKSLIERLPEPFKKCIGLTWRTSQKIMCAFVEWNQNTSIALNMIVFIVGLAVILYRLSSIVQPVWKYSNYNPVYGIYKDANTLQALFIGTSQIRCGVSPMELYKRYGILAQDISTDTQPIAASFFLLKEVYQYHSESLKTVIVDVSGLLHDAPAAKYHKVIDFMHFSINKLQAIKSYSGNFTELLMNTIPLLTYHERWKELHRGDVTKYKRIPQLFWRGYIYHDSEWIAEGGSSSNIVIPLRFLDQNAEIRLKGKSVKYFKEMADFCREHDLRLLLIKTPTNWNSGVHNAIQAMADEYGLDFLDFNTEPYYSIIDFNLAANVIWPGSAISTLHLNYFGATKLTDYLGKYLTEKCGARDVRGDPKYAFMDEQLADYHRHIIGATLMQFTDPCDYIKYALGLGQYTIFISARDDAAISLTDAQRNYFASIGMPELSNLKENSSYLAVIDDGKIIAEMSKEDPGAPVEEESAEGAAEKVDEAPISFAGKTSDKTAYKITSGGKNSGDTSDITIGGAKRSPNKRGLNIVLYDNKMHKFAANAIFDTHAAPLRPIQNVEERLKAELEAGATLPELTGVDRQLYLYNRRCDSEMKKALSRTAARENDLPSYLAEFLDDEKLEIYLAAKNDATLALTDESREKLRDILPKLSKLNSGESYVAVISGGKVIAEKTSHADDPLEVRTDKYLLRSGKRESENISTLMFDGKNYMDEKDGLHVLIYDTLTGLIVDNVTFGAQAEEVAR